MGAREAPAPMPLSMRDQVNQEMSTKDFELLGNNARYVIRWLVADAYAKGFRDGRLDQRANDYADRDAQERRKQIAERNAQKRQEEIQRSQEPEPPTEAA